MPNHGPVDFEEGNQLVASDLEPVDTSAEGAREVEIHSCPGRGCGSQGEGERRDVRQRPGPLKLGALVPWCHDAVREPLGRGLAAAVECAVWACRRLVCCCGAISDRGRARA